MEIVLHYFKFNIGDYHKKAGRLSMIEHGAYTLLLHSCYDREQFPTEEEAIKWCWARSADEIAAVKFVLEQFFTIEDGRYVQSRIAEEIATYRAKSDTNRAIALDREARKRTNREPDVQDRAPNHKPITTNQEPITNNQLKEKKQRGSRFDLVDMPDEWLDFCKQERQDIDPRKTFDAFRDYWIAQPGSKGVKADWLATWRNWVRSTRVSPNTQQAKNDRKSQLIYGSWERTDDFIDMGDANAIPLPLR